MSNTLYNELKSQYEETFNGEDDNEECSFREFLLGDGIEEKGYEVIYQKGGEGEGEHAETVFKLNDDIYKVVYSYYSYDGFSFDYPEAFKVVPKEKTITVYE